MIVNNNFPSSGLKIATGKYIGTGTYGSSNPNILKFDFEPYIVFIASGVGVQRSACFFKGKSFCDWHKTSDKFYYARQALTWEGNSLKWYCSKAYYYNVLGGAAIDDNVDAENQLNTNSSNYYYVAIGK